MKSDEILFALQSEVKKETPQANPYTPNGFLRGLLNSIAKSLEDLYTYSDKQTDNYFIQTADFNSLFKRANELGVTMQVAEKSYGRINFIGNVGAVLPAETAINTQDGQSFITTETAIIREYAINVEALTSSHGVVTITSTNHNLTNNSQIAIVSSTINKTYTPSVVNKDTFTIMEQEPLNISDIIITSIFGVAHCVSQIGGVKSNIPPNTPLKFENLLPDIQDECYVVYNGFSGGADADDIESFRDRLLDRVRNPQAPFSDNHIKATIKDKIPTVTRVKLVQDYPSNGQLTVFIMEDYNPLKIPSADTLSKAKEAILSIKSAFIHSDNILVKSPIRVPINIAIKDIDKLSFEDKDKIKQAIIELYDTQEIGDKVTTDEIVSVIRTTLSGYRFELIEPRYANDLQQDQVASVDDVKFI